MVPSVQSCAFRCGTLAAAVVFAAVLAPAAMAMTATTERVPAAITYFGPSDPRTTATVLHRLTLTAGATDEILNLEVDTLIPLTVDGPATLRQTGGISALGPVKVSADRRDRCPLPPSAGGATYAITLPAGTTSVVTYTQQGPRSGAPRDPATFVAHWSLAALASTTEPASAMTTATTNYAEPAPKLLGLKPADLTLLVRRSGSRTAAGAGDTLPARRGAPITFEGRLRPTVANATITLWNYAPGAKRATRLDTVRTDASGRYVLRRWRPRRSGAYEFYATFAGQKDRVDSTRSPCEGPQLTVRR